jgi:hypothetical protein
MIPTFPPWFVFLCGLFTGAFLVTLANRRPRNWA